MHADHLGSASLTTDASGKKLGELRYKPYGETRYIWGVTRTDRRFTGQIDDAAIGLYFYNARYYDHALGRFISADTVAPEPGNPQALNRYSYCGGNPLRFTDPSGHSWLTDQLVALGQRSELARGLLVSAAEAVNALNDPERSPTMEGIRQTVGQGVAAVGMAGSVAHYTTQAVLEGRWDDAARGGSGLAQMGGAVIAKSPEMAAQFAVGVVAGPFVNAWEFGVSIRECAQGTRSGWDVAYHGLGVAATLLGTGRALGETRAARLAATASSATEEPLPPGWTEGWHQEWGTRATEKAPHWWDPDGGEWRYHPADRHHRIAHWDHNPWNTWNDKWVNIDSDGNTMP